MSDERIKIRIKFNKHGVLRYIGHLDMMRYFQKAFRRSGLDIAYSTGYSPHQIMSFAFPLGVGMESDGEYVDVEMASIVSTEDVKEKLEAQMAEGVHILSVVRLPDNAKNAMAIVAAAGYYLYLKEDKPIDIHLCEEEETRQAIDDFLALDTIVVTKETKKSVLEVDLRPGIYDFALKEYDNMPAYYVCVNASSSGNIKPTMVLDAFYKTFDETFDASAYRIVRAETYQNIGDEENPIFVPMDDVQHE